MKPVQSMLCALLSCSASLWLGVGCTVQYSAPAMYYVPPDTDATIADATGADAAGAADVSADAAPPDSVSTDGSGADLPPTDVIAVDSTLADSGSAMTCADRCGKPFTSTKPCQCTWDCAKYGTCCPDWLAICHPTDNLDWYHPPAGVCSKASDWIAVKSNPDGDTLHLPEIDSAGYHLAVRFLLVDTPETTTSECMSAEAKKVTWESLLNSGLKVCLVAEPGGEDKDMYGRLLRYVYVKDPGQPLPVQLNLRLLRLGLGRVLYPFATGNSLEKVALQAMAKAKDDKLGGWGKCGWLKPK